MPVPVPNVLNVLHEDAEWVVVNKPAGLVCHPTKGDAWSSLISRLRLHTGLPTVTLVNRLDRETSGVVVAAKSRAVAGELGKLFAGRSVAKDYLAIVHGHPPQDTFTVAAPLGRAVGSPVAIQDAVRPDGLPASTRFTVLARFLRDGESFGLLRAEPQEGRKHQIRIHLAHAGFPIVGDKIYGGDPGRYLRFVRRELTDADRAALRLEHQALHAGRLAFSWRGEAWCFEAKPENGFLAFLAGTPGADAVADREGGNPGARVSGPIGQDHKPVDGPGSDGTLPAPARGSRVAQW